MSAMRLLCLPLISVLVAFAPARSAIAESAIGDLIDAVLAGSHRQSGNAERDKYRHPRETLEFFGLEADDTVVELAPGAGWYTEVLAPVLRKSGRLFVVDVLVAGREMPERYVQRKRDLLARIESNPDVYGTVVPVDFTLPGTVDMVKPGSADLVVTFRNVHNWTQAKIDGEVFKAAFRALKPGGVLGVVDHRAKEGASVEEIVKSGYIPESYVVELAKSAGFELDARSEVNANPKDAKDYAEGVWTLPPSLVLGDVDRDKYLAIGESDRMTLRFRKPAS
jgi:predicted methyltransferase